jgi:predicted outer membrane repeat protein
LTKFKNSGTFTMNNGTIAGNTATSFGGGVYVSNATFTKSASGGIIYGSNAPDGQANKSRANGHAVYVNSSGKQRNTTARVSQAIGQQ